MRFDTLAIHAGQPPDPTTGAIMVPVYQTSTYAQAAPGQHQGYEYSRTSNPTRRALEANLAALESGEWGLSFASGMAATDAILHLLDAGDHVVAGNDLYGGTYRLFTQVFARAGLTFTFVDARDLQQIREAFTPRTRLLWLESPTNPMLRISPLAQAVALGHEGGALVAVDNTFATPYLQQPLQLGADLAVHSVTKYLAGHSDLVGGAVVGRDFALQQRLAFLQNSIGAVPGPLDCFLTLRGIKTLPVRMQRHCDNARRVVEFLQQHPRVTRVHYPGLPDSEGYETARRQMRDFGGMLSFELEGTVEDACQVTARTRILTCAESLGGVESLIEHPASMTHASVPAAERRAAGLPDGLIRISVGIEDPQDLVEDLDQALSAP